MVIRHLPFFLVVAEEQNFQRASQRLNIAQSALSRRIRDLEAELGDVPLFVRMSRGVRLTPSGQALLEDTRLILAAVEDATERAARVMNGEAGALRIGYSIGAVRHAYITDLFNAFRSAFPKVSLDTSLMPVEQIAEKLKEGAIDAALFYTPELGDEFSVLELAEEEFLLALPATHRLATVETLYFADIVDEDFIWYAKMFSPTVHDRMLAEFAKRGAAPRIKIESPTADTTIRLAASGLGIGFVPAMEEAQLSPDVVLKPIEDFKVSWRFRLVWLRSNRSVILPRLIDAVSVAINPSGTGDEGDSGA